VSELKALLQAFARGQASFEKVSAFFDRCLDEAPERGPELLQALKEARAAGLPHHVYVALSSRVPDAPPASSAHPDRTALLSDDGPGRTRDDSDPTGRQPAEERTGKLPDGAGRARDADATVLARDDESGAAGGGRAERRGGGDPDATVLAGDDDGEPTAAGPRPAAPATRTPRAADRDAGDATVLAGDDGDATRLDTGGQGDEARTGVDARAGAGEEAPATGIRDDDGDATQVNAASLDDEVTRMGDTGGATEVRGGAATSAAADSTLVTDAGGGDEDEFDILGDDALAAAESAGAGAQTGASWPTSTDAEDGGTAAPFKDYGAGDLLRGRFELISKLGEGGMGAVWKGKDLLKVEARDRNPFVAIKLLQGDFKEHPESFIALQRETSKQQRLAHPNIATVYDFDRDMDTGTVFMTMEVMEGEPLDAFIRKLPVGGLDYEDAMPLVEDICAGLAYAHQAGLVHSDLKPGNAFLVRDPERKLGRVKLLDFGIARASKTRTDAEGEKTLFDPGELGALTPTYATIEMFEGLDPDPRDDIYALAIMAYQLLTGKHPYNKKPAPKAKELGLAVEPVAKLNKRQNRALAKGLAFLRDDRTDTVVEFLEELKPRVNRAPLIAGGSIAALLIIGVLSYTPVKEFLEERKNQEIVAEISAGGVESIRSGLARIESFDDARRERITRDDAVQQAVIDVITRGDAQSITSGLAILGDFSDDARREVMESDPVRTAIFDHHNARIQAAFDPAEGKYDFVAAMSEIETLNERYPRDADVFRRQTQLENQRDAEINALNDRYNRYLEEGRILPSPEEEDVGDVLQTVAAIDPDNPLLSDRQLPIRFADLASEAMAAEDYQRAKRFLDASVAYAPDDATLANLRFDVERELKRQRDAALVAQIERRLQASRDQLRSLSDFQQVRDDIIQLADLRPESPVLETLQSFMKSAFTEQLDRSIAEQTWREAEQLVADFAKLFDVPFLIEQRARLTRAEREAGFQLAMTDERREMVQAHTAEIERLLAEPSFDDDWELDLQLGYKELIALLPPDDPTLANLRNRVARLYLGEAQELRAENRFAEAVAFVNKGEQLYPGLRDFDAEREAIAAAEAALRRQQEEERRLARLEQLKRTLIAKANADQPQEAMQVFEELKRELPANDPFLAAEGPQAIARAYQRLAAAQAEQEQFENAATFAEAGLALAPKLAALEQDLALYREEVSKRQLVIRLGKLFDSLEPLSVEAVRDDLEQVRLQFPDRDPAYAEEFAASRAARIRSLPTANGRDLATVAARLGEFAALFPEQGSALETTIAERVKEQIVALESSAPERAHQMLASAAQALGGPVIDSIELAPLPTESEVAVRGLQEVEKGMLSRAAATLQEVQQAQPNALNLPELRQAYEKRRSTAEQYFNAFMKYKQAGQARSDKARQYLRVAIGQWVDNRQYRNEWAEITKATAAATRSGHECAENLAGKGTSKRAVCYDPIGEDGRGPDLVVVPAGGPTPEPFAIGKYEVSVADFNFYCRVSGACQPIASDSDLPVTGVSLQQAEAYAGWLSEQTGAVYRLPTEQEWEYAAQAGGQQPEKDFNCRVVLGSQVLKGHQLVPVRSGRQNGWGLQNYVGNAQEWVRSGSGLAARGGAYEDTLTKCDVSLSKTHGGGADEITSFRLVREMG